MNVAQLQGTPWHTEQRKKTCKDDSKYCIYNHNICSCVANKQNYHKKCIGKASCLWFEPKTGSPKIYSEKIIKVPPTFIEQTSKDKNEKESKTMNETSNNYQPENTENNASPKDKFLRLSQRRVNEIKEGLRLLSNLANKNNYSYTDEQIEAMFSYIDVAVAKAKESFKDKGFLDDFTWDK